MSDSIPPTDPHAGDLARQKAILTIVLLSICVGAVVMLFAFRRAPLPMRVALGTGDLIAAAAIWLVIRQKFTGK